MKPSLFSDPSTLSNANSAGRSATVEIAGAVDRGGESTRVPAAARAVLQMLKQLSVGSLHVSLPNRQTLSFGSGQPTAQVRVLDWAMFKAVLGRGDIGFAEAWMSRQWTSPNLVEVLDLMVANRQALEKVVYGSWWGQLLYRFKHALNRNNRTGSKRNIHAHYDLGNDFYSLWLDSTMTYSSALYEGDFDRPLRQAQSAKYARLYEQARLTPGQSVLEIGCGWGGFAQFAQARGAQVTGLTLSLEQLDFAAERLRGGAETATAAAPQILLQDYRDHRGQYDAIVSIEMFEAVGEPYWTSYFDSVSRCLKPGGRAAIQTIVIAEELFERYRRGTDFIQQYVFPGGMLPARSKFIAAAQRSGLRYESEFSFGQDYAHTLKLWRQSFFESADRIAAQGFDPRFMRLWEFYLAYCESAFRFGNTDVTQFTLVKD
jgi:cyclopropane-fatty-acyl-phospholipid synthase